MNPFVVYSLMVTEDKGLRSVNTLLLGNTEWGELGPELQMVSNIKNKLLLGVGGYDESSCLEMRKFWFLLPILNDFRKISKLGTIISKIMGADGKHQVFQTVSEEVKCQLFLLLPWLFPSHPCSSWIQPKSHGNRMDLRKMCKGRNFFMNLIAIPKGQRVEKLLFECHFP